MVRTAAEEREHWDALIGEDVDGLGSGNIYHSGVCGEESQRDSMAQIVPTIAPHLRPGARILDLGCGPGRLTVPVARLCPQATVVGVDVSPRAIQWACGSKDRAPNATYLVGNGRDVHNLGTFDAAYSMLLFQHLEWDVVAGYIASVASELRPGGVFRFQFTVGDTHEPYAHDHDLPSLWQAMNYSWLVPREPEDDPLFPTWRWVTATKREPF